MMKLATAALAVAIMATPAVARCRGGDNVSWYGEPQRLRGGGKFHPNDSTCASPTEPDGTILRIKVTGGPAIDCRVNDRGPAPETGCKLDVSRKIARLLGILDRGTGRFAIQVLRRP